MSPSAAEALLVNLASRGIELRVEGERLRYRPPQAVSPELAVQLKTYKAQILVVLNGLAARLDELRRYVAARSSDRAWCELWNRRLRLEDGWKCVVRVAGYLIEDYAEPAAASGNLKHFDEWNSYIRVCLLEAPDWERRAYRLAASGS